MSKVQAFSKNERRAALEFFRAKTRKEDFGVYLPMESRQQRLREVAASALAVGSRKFTRYEYEPVRGARARV